MSREHNFFACESSRYIIHYLNFRDLVAFAHSSKIGFQFACKIRHLTVSGPELGFVNSYQRKNHLQEWINTTDDFFLLLRTLLQIINKATYLNSVTLTNFNNVFLQQYLLRLRFSKNLQILQFRDNRMPINFWTKLFTRWKDIYKELIHVTAIDMLEKDAYDFWGLNCILHEHAFNQHNVDELLAAMCCLFPSLERVRVSIPNKTDFVGFKEYIQNKYGVRLQFVCAESTIERTKLYALHWNVARIEMGLGDISWAS